MDKEAKAVIFFLKKLIMRIKLDNESLSIQFRTILSWDLIALFKLPFHQCSPCIKYVNLSS